jgi:hypothetical protein
MEEADIRVSGLGVGKVRLDVAKIRGEGENTILNWSSQPT